MQEKEEITADYLHRIYLLSGKSGLPIQKRGYFYLDYTCKYVI